MIKPLKDYCLVKKVQRKSQGIIMQEEMPIYEVVEIGKLVIGIRKGSLVLIKGELIKVDDEFLVKEDQIIAVVED